MSARKAADRRQGRDTKDVGGLASVTRLGVSVPPMRRGYLKVTVDAWETFWHDDVSRLVKPADMPALHRLFGMYDDRERATRAFRLEPATAGSMGQLVVSPFAKEITSLDARIDKLEAAFGITPKARLALGISLGAAAKSLDEINRAFDEPDDDEGEDTDDPRLRVIEATAT